MVTWGKNKIPKVYDGIKLMVLELLCIEWLCA